MQTILLLLYPIVNAILNRWPRGTYSWGPWVAGAIMAGLIFAITMNYLAAGAFFVLYGLGESFGWGKWLATVPFWKDKAYTQEMYLQSKLYPRDDGKNNGVHLFANLISDETKDFKSYAWWALFFRGILWQAPIFVVLAGLGVMSPFVVPFAIGILAIAFPVLYSMAYKLFGDKYWTMGELLYGLVQGLVMAAALATGILL
jgi:hypothetical protein